MAALIIIELAILPLAASAILQSSPAISQARKPALKLNKTITRSRDDVRRRPT
jgi:hypothetical protein